MKRHKNIPIFIPHLGCPNQCVFCNQRTISGHGDFDISNVKFEIDTALSTINEETETEIAFFGGSFTGIDRSLMIELLTLAHSYIECGRVSAIRCSTRPDYIDNEVLDILEKYGVKTVELGLQSVYDAVLSLTKRGHTFYEEERACKLLVERGFNLVGQMMIGLPGSALETELETADFIIKSGATGARIYPTVVFRDTELCEMAALGLYQPLCEDEAVYRSARVLERFIESGVEVIRIGLCAQDNLYDEENYYAGPVHSAMGELVIGEVYFNKISSELNGLNQDITNKTLHITVSLGSSSKVIGQRRRNANRLADIFRLKNVIVDESERLSGYEFKIDF